MVEMSSGRCPSCGAASGECFYTQRGAPAHSCLLLPTLEAARRFPRGDIRLVLCGECGCIWNAAFDTRLTQYSERYEDSQAFSPRFGAFMRGLAERLIDRYQVRGKHILEIGCGKGDFLNLLCELGGNTGVGIDPAADPTLASESQNITFIVDEYSERYAHLPADLVACRHTLEHLPNAGEFLRTMGSAAHDVGTGVAYLEVPDVERVLAEGAFWDVYYEHVCYFTSESFARLAGRAGFEILSLEAGFDSQYLMLEARPSPHPDRATPADAPRDLPRLAELTERFAVTSAERIHEWNAILAKLRHDGRRVAVWGSGSKAVAFLSILDAGGEVDCVVDINPRKHEMYMAGTTQRIVPPALLQERRPDVVVVMNPVYRDEIREELDSLGLTPVLMTL
jgi:SAM-dependent methyltransferase